MVPEDIARSSTTAASGYWSRANSPSRRSSANNSAGSSSSPTSTAWTRDALQEKDADRQAQEAALQKNCRPGRDPTAQSPPASPCGTLKLRKPVSASICSPPPVPGCQPGFWKRSCLQGRGIIEPREVAASCSTPKWVRLEISPFQRPPLAGQRRKIWLCLVKTPCAGRQGLCGAKAHARTLTGAMARGQVVEGDIFTPTGPFPARPNRRARRGGVSMAGNHSASPRGGLCS